MVDFRIRSRAVPGDYNSDGHVDSLDYDAWKSAFGTTNLAADGNGNGIVDAGDYTVWRNHLGVGGGGLSRVVPEPAGGLFDDRYRGVARLSLATVD